jgi:2-polyprenyl-3-methyl-5-hydroxy-6-metoxy-1,4-benzoquinol methylase
MFIPNFDRLNYTMSCVVCNLSISDRSTVLCVHCKRDPYKVEKARDIFAKNKRFDELRMTYSRKFGEIPNINSPKLWDRLLFGKRGLREKSPITNDRINEVLRMIENKRGRLLDVGFGQGFIEKRASKDRFDLYGIEISQIAVKRVEATIDGNFKIGSILEIPFHNNFFDVVLVLEVLEHISPHNTFKGLKEVKRVLKNEGLLIVSVPLNEDLKEMCEEGQNPNAHVRVYTPELIKAELKIAGFKIQKESLLYAFENFYQLKKILQKILFRNRWRPNDIVILAQKP